MNVNYKPTKREKIYALYFQVCGKGPVSGMYNELLKSEC